MAHHKLRALGVDLESAERIIKNPHSQQFKSPIRYDRLRPMPAVLHAQYSFTYVAALDVAIIRAGQDPARDRVIAELALAKIIPKLHFGLAVIKEHAVVDSAGADFLRGFFSWSDRIFEDASNILDQFQIAAEPFVHPLEVQKTASERSNQSSPGQPCRRRGVTESSLSDGRVVYRSGRATGLSLNSSATAIWDLCDGGNTVADIAHQLGLRLGCPGEYLLSDAKVAIAQFGTLGLLEPEEAVDP
jgi:hypothetical protein